MFPTVAARNPLNIVSSNTGAMSTFSKAKLAAGRRKCFENTSRTSDNATKASPRITPVHTAGNDRNPSGAAIEGRPEPAAMVMTTTGTIQMSSLAVVQFANWTPGDMPPTPGSEQEPGADPGDDHDRVIEQNATGRAQEVIRSHRVAWSRTRR